MDKPLAFLPGVPGIDVHGSALKVKCCCHSIHCMHAIVFKVLAVRVQIDEARCHDQAMRVDHSAAGQRILRNRSNCRSGYAYVADGIKDLTPGR